MNGGFLHTSKVGKRSYYSNVNCVPKMKNSFDHLSRRELLKGVGQAGLAGVITPLAGVDAQPQAKNRLIEAENNKPGTTDWQLTFVRSNNYRSEMIEGYCSHT